jgi:hypothetical protein
MRPGAIGEPLWFALAAVFVCLSWGAVSPARAADPPEALATAAEPSPKLAIEADSPNISPIDASSTTCYRAEETSETCYIEWPYVYVTAGTSQYIISMTTEIDGRVRVHTQGFFQTSMYVPSDMYAPGFAVDCGQPGSDGIPDLGNVYFFSITARETGGGSSTRSTDVLCPYTLHIFSDGFESSTSSAWSAITP